MTIMRIISCAIALLCLNGLSYASRNEIDELVTRLGNARFSERSQADAALRAMEKDAVPVLDQYRNHKDPEIRVRVRVIIQYLKTKSLKLRFTDEHLEAVLKAALSVETLTDQNTLGLKRLNASQSGILYLDGLSQLVSLEVLDIQGNSISNINELSEMYSLRSVDLRDNRITDIQPLVENAEKRNNSRSMNLQLTGNPLTREAASGNIDVLRKMNHRVEYLRQEPLPDDWKTFFHSQTVRPYERLRFIIEPPVQEANGEAARSSSPWLYLDAASAVEIDGVSRRIKGGIAVINMSNGKSWHLFTTSYDDAVRPPMPGEYTYTFVVRFGDAIWTCPPATVTVSASENDRAALDAFEHNDGGKFLHSSGFRQASGTAAPDICYGRLVKFVEDYPQSYLSKILGEKVYVIFKDERDNRGELNAQDRAALAKIGALTNPNQIRNWERQYNSIAAGVEKMRNNAGVKSDELKKAERSLMIVKAWVANAKQAAK